MWSCVGHVVRWTDTGACMHACIPTNACLARIADPTCALQGAHSSTEDAAQQHAPCSARSAAAAGTGPCTGATAAPQASHAARRPLLPRTCELVGPSPRGLDPHLLGAPLGPVPVQALGLDEIDGVLHPVGLKLDEVQPACGMRCAGGLAGGRGWLVWHVCMRPGCGCGGGCKVCCLVLGCTAAVAARCPGLLGALAGDDRHSGASGPAGDDRHSGASGPAPSETCDDSRRHRRLVCGTSCAVLAVQC
jgi:hypothetical protein